MQSGIWENFPLHLTEGGLRTSGGCRYLTPNLSETLGPTADWDVNLWLADVGIVHLRKQQSIQLKLQNVLDSLVEPPLLGKADAGLLVFVMDDQDAPGLRGLRCTRGLMSSGRLWKSYLVLQAWTRA
jgi:hypothetical protein